MRHRLCPFCSSDSSNVFGSRGGLWVRCRSCRSVFQDITVDKFEQLHVEAFQDSRFTESTVAARGLEPSDASWEELRLPGVSLLEIGPGTGHLLAAAHKAGRRVTAVESSEIHRVFIQETWGIDSYPDMAALPQDMSFDAIVAINVLEHVYDITDFLSSIKQRLAPKGLLFISTVNAASFEAALLRNWWSMCKVHDHVSFPSCDGMARVARAIGLRANRVWSSELPFEFPISALVAARDWSQERRRRPSNPMNDARVPEEIVQPVNASARARLARFYSISGRFDPTSRLLGALGRAGSIKAHLTTPDALN